MEQIDKEVGTIFRALETLQTYKTSTKKAFNNVLKNGIQGENLQPLEVQIISLQNFMDTLGYKSVEGCVPMTRGFELKRPLLFKRFLPKRLSFASAVWLHNLELSKMNNLPFVTVKGIPFEWIEIAQQERVVSKVGLQVVKQIMKRDKKRGSILRTTKLVDEFI